jgi:bifunctional DNA-binding transcriptional regulator/antitoxin component of YhaV-PrlF toxin-antitoxin module
MSDNPQMGFATTSPSLRAVIGAKGRTVLPADVRKAAGFAEGTEVIAHAEGRGRVVVETPDAIRDRIWAASPPQTGIDATQDIRAARDEDSRLSDQAAAHRSAERNTADSDASGEALLKHLGLV